MRDRIVLKEIPAGKFHSAIFTTYSLNLYYIEQQVIPLLGGKDIHYLSILADSNMLSSQLEEYSSYSQYRKRNYAIHGIKCGGAFHPKIIFFVGPDSLLLLLGSGNLTSSGHGKNLEVWNFIFITNPEDKKLGFVLQAWNYLKDLYNDLGDSGKTIIKNIEENSLLLNQQLNINAIQSIDLDSNNKLSFIFPNPNQSMFNQLNQIIGNEKIDRITVMSPFYDTEGKFILELHRTFKPQQINIIVQEDFGVAPFKMRPKPNMQIFDWRDIQKEQHRQEFFHAKNIVFEGKKNSYLVSGSANASIAAFGNQTELGVNQEACIVYQSKSQDYIQLLGLKLRKKTVKLSDYSHHENNAISQFPIHSLPVFIKTAEKTIDEVVLTLTSPKIFEKATICLCFSESKPNYEKVINIIKGESLIKLQVQPNLQVIYVEVRVKGKKISNKQFITDLVAFEGSNPSPRSRSLNQILKMIENKGFSTSKIIDYLSTIHKVYPPKNSLPIGSKSDKPQTDVLDNEQESDLLYLNYEEIQRRAKEINEFKKPNTYINYKGVRLWDSIFSYLKDSREKEIQEKIDEEETEDINKSSGKEKKEKKVKSNPISSNIYKKLVAKVERFLNNYIDIIHSKTESTTSSKPTLVDLSMYLIILEILLHIISHKEEIEGEKDQMHLLEHLAIHNDYYSWSDYLIMVIGNFTMWVIQNNGFQEVESKEYKLKQGHYIDMANKTTLACLSVYRIINKNQLKGRNLLWLYISLLNTQKAFNHSNVEFEDLEKYMDFFPLNLVNELGEDNLKDEIDTNRTYIAKRFNKQLPLRAGEVYLHPDFGYTVIGKVIPNPAHKYFLKLYHPAFDWDDEERNYWNGKVYSKRDRKWYGSFHG